MSDGPTTPSGSVTLVLVARQEASDAMSFLRQVEGLAESMQSLRPDGELLAKAAEDARAAALEAVLVWRTTFLDARRRAIRPRPTRDLTVVKP